jgi:hypothetical protein
MTGYKIVVYAPGSAPRAVHMGASEADMLSHLSAVERAFQATRATVKARRKLVCERWSALGYDVEAEAIPEAWDLRG